MSNSEWCPSLQIVLHPYLEQDMIEEIHQQVGATLAPEPAGDDDVEDDVGEDINEEVDEAVSDEESEFKAFDNGSPVRPRASGRR